MVNNSNEQISCLFKGRFFKVAESKETMLDKKTGEVNYYYSMVLSNGVRTFGCTCGENSDLVKVDLFKPCMMYIDVVEKNGIQKLKVVKADTADGKGGVSDGK